MKIHLPQSSNRITWFLFVAGLTLGLSAQAEVLVGNTLTEDFEESETTLLSRIPDGNGWNISYPEPATGWEENGNTQIETGSPRSGLQSIVYNGKADGTSGEELSRWDYNFTQSYDFTNVSSISLWINNRESGGLNNWWAQLDVALLDADGDVHARTDMEAPSARKSWAQVNIATSGAQEPDIAGLRFEQRRESFRNGDDFIYYIDDFEAVGVVIPEPRAYALIGGVLALGAVILWRRRS